MPFLLPLDVAPSPGETVGPFLILGIAVVAVVFGLVFWIRRLRKR